MAEKNSLWKNIRNKAKQNRESGATPKQPTLEMLRQERKIRAKQYAEGSFVGEDKKEPIAFEVTGPTYEVIADSPNSNPNPYSPVTGAEFLNSGFNPINWFLPSQVEKQQQPIDPKTGMPLPQSGKADYDYGTEIGLAAPLTSAVKKGLKLFNTPKSSIDWNKWSADAASNPNVVKHLNDIEKKSKKSGTWMKDFDIKDGKVIFKNTPFKGTPEEFVVQQSDNFKKAFPNGVETMYTGSNRHIFDYANHDEWGKGNKAIFGTSSEANAGAYGWDDVNNKAKPNFDPQDPRLTYEGEMRNGDFEGGVHKLGFSKDIPSVTGEGGGRGWRLVDWDDNVAKGTKLRPRNNESLVKEHNEFLQGIYNNGDYLKRDYDIDGFDPNKEYLSTDLYANYITNPSNTEAVAKVNNTIDTMGKRYMLPQTTFALDPKRVPVKSMRHNIMFDMDNPNIYKSILPAIGTGALGIEAIDKYYNNKQQQAAGGYYPTQGPPKALFKGYAEGGYVKQYATGSTVTEDDDKNKNVVLRPRSVYNTETGLTRDFQSSSDNQTWINNNDPTQTIRHQLPEFEVIEEAPAWLQSVRENPELYNGSGRADYVPIEAALLPASLPFQATSRLGKAALFAAETQNPGFGINSAFNKLGSVAARGIQNAAEKLPTGAVRDNIYGVGRGISDIQGGRPFFETFPITKKQRLAVEASQDKAFNEGLDFVKKWNYANNGLRFRPEVKERIKNIYSGPLLNTNSLIKDNPIYTANNLLVNSKRSSLFKNDNISDETKKYIASNRGRIGGTNMGSTNESITLRNHGLYYNEPQRIKDVAAHELGHSMQKFGTIYDNWGKSISKDDPDYLYRVANTDTPLGKIMGDAMVDPVKGKYTWEASPLEPHSELMVARMKAFDHYKSKGKNDEEIIQFLQNPNDRLADQLIKAGGLDRFFKPTTSQEVKRDIVRALPAVVPAVGIGAGALQQSQEQATGGYTMKNNNQSWKQYLQYAQGGYTNPYNQYQDDPYLQYAYGGYEYGNGGRTLKNIGAGAFGVLEGLVDTTFGWIPGVDQATDAAYRGLQKLGGSSEDEIREQDSIHGYGQTAGAVGSAILTSGATTGSAISEGAEGLGQGISRGSETSEVAQGIGKGLNIAGAVVGTAYNASNASKASTEAFKLSNAGSQGIGKFAAAAPKSATALNAARTARAANSLDSAGNVIGNAAPEGTKIVTDAAGNASSIKPPVGVFAAPTPSAPNVSSLAPNLPAAATASAAIPKSLPTSVPSTSDYSRLEKIGNITSAISSLPKKQEPPEMAPPVPVPPAPKPQPQVNYDQFAVNAPTINTGFETPNYDFGYETPSNNYYAAQGGNITNNSLNLRNTMRYKRFAKGGTFDQYGINMIPDSAGLHHESAYGGVPIGPDALAEGGEIKMSTGDGGQYIVSDKVDGAETQKDFMFSKGGKYKELNRTLADGMKQDLDRYTFGSLATSDRVKGDLRRPFDSYSQSTIEQIKNKWQQKTEYARQRSQQEQAIAQAEEQKRMAEEQYIAAYGGKINPKKYPGLNMTKKARGGYVYNPMTQPMLATGGPVYGDPASPYTYAMGGMYGDPYARGGQIDYTNDMYAGGGPLVGNVPQPFNGPAAQNRGGMLMNYADGGMVSPEQQMMQEQQMQQQGGGEEQMMQMVQQVAQAIMGGANPEQIMQQLVQSGIPPEQAQQVIQAAMQMASQQQPMQQEQQMMPQQGMADGGMMQQQPGAATKIAEALQQGAQPQDILKQLIDSGMPQEQAMAMVQAVMGQLKNQMQQQPQQQMMAPQQPMMAARGGYFNGRKQYAESGEILPTIIPATDEHPSYFEGVAYDNPSDTSSPSYPVSINPTQYDKYTGKSTTAPTGWRPQSDIINSAQSQNNKMFPESWQTIAAGTAQALPGLASAAYSFGKLKDRKLTPNLTPSTTVDYSSERVDLREEGRRGIATALDTMKRNAPTSGSYMSNAREAVLRGNKVIGNQISKSWQNQKNEQAKYDFESGKINADTRNKINEINEGMYQNAIEQGFRSSQDAINKVANYYTGKEGRDIQRWQAQNTNTTNHLWYTPVAGQPPVQVFKNKDGEFWYGDKRIG